MSQSGDRALSRRDLLSVRNLLAPLVATAGSTGAARFVASLGAALPESRTVASMLNGAPTIPVRCPW